MAELARQLVPGAVVTLVGPPGVGKTRLAVEVAHRSELPAVFVDLAKVGSSEALPGAVATALGLRQRSDRSLVNAIGRWLCDNQTLIVLDNCEHLLSAVGELVTVAMERASKTIAIATSRELLGLSIETAFAVQPLDHGTAVRLFCERALAVQPTFEMAPEVDDICSHLDGVPLAVELAAARASTLAPAEISRRLGERFHLLTGGHRDSSSHHRSLDTAVAWSYELLDEPERALLRRLSCFAGFSDNAAGDQVTLGRLVDHSLVVAEGSRYRMLEIVRRFGQERAFDEGELEGLRDQHAAWCLEVAEDHGPCISGPGHREAVARLSAEHDNFGAALGWLVESSQSGAALRLVNKLAMYWGDRGHVVEGRRWIRLALNQEGRTESLDWAWAYWSEAYLACLAGEYGVAERALAEIAPIAERNTDLAARTQTVLAHCANHYHFPGTREALDNYQRAAALARSAGDPWALAVAMNGAAWQYANQNDLSTARGMAEEAVRVSRDSQNDDGLLTATDVLASIRLREGDAQAAELLLLDVLDTARQVGSPEVLVAILTTLADLLATRGHHTAANTLFEEAFASARATGNRPGMIVAAVGEAQNCLRRGALAAAHYWFNTALSTAAKCGEGSDDAYSSASAVSGLGQVALAQNDPWSARALLEQALNQSRRKDPDTFVDALHNLGLIARIDGDLDQAASRHLEAFQLCSEAQDGAGQALALDALAGVASASGRYTVAAESLAAAAAARQASGWPDPIPSESRWRDADLRVIRERLSASDLERASIRGMAMSLDDAVQPFRSRMRSRAGWGSLSPAEQRACFLSADGLSNHDIAEQLGLSMATVKSYMKQAFRKLDISSRQELDRVVEQQRVALNPLGIPTESAAGRRSTS